MESSDSDDNHGEDESMKFNYVKRGNNIYEIRRYNISYKGTPAAESLPVSPNLSFTSAVLSSRPDSIPSLSGSRLAKSTQPPSSY